MAWLDQFFQGPQGLQGVQGVTGPAGLLGSSRVGTSPTTVADDATDWIACAASSTTTLYTLPSPVIAAGEVVSMTASIEIDGTSVVGSGHFERRFSVKNIGGTIKTPAGATTDEDVTVPAPPNNLSASLTGVTAGISIVGGTMVVTVSTPLGITVNASASVSWDRAPGNATVPSITITSVFPSGGTTAGGTVIDIRGTSLPLSGATVLFGSTPAASITYITSTHMQVTSPAMSAGDVTLTVNSVSGGLYSQVPGLLHRWNADNAGHTSTSFDGSIADDISGGPALNHVAGATFTASDINGHASVSSSTGMAVAAGSITKAQPLDWWVVAKTITWASNGALVSCPGGIDAIVLGGNVGTPGLGSYAGSGVGWSGNDTDLPVGTWGFIRYHASGGSSTIKVGQSGSVVTLSPGTNGMGGTVEWGLYAGSSFYPSAISLHMVCDPAASGYSASQIEGWLHRDYGL